MLYCLDLINCILVPALGLAVGRNSSNIGANIGTITTELPRMLVRNRQNWIKSKTNGHNSQ